MSNVILLVSGKRKSGKDFICEKLKSVLGEEKCTILRISEPLKRCYAQDHNLDLKELMSDSFYKEKYRCDMIKWSDQIREEKPGYFCKATCETAPKKLVWIVSDIRRKTDIKWFVDTYTEKIKTVRISAELETRVARGWTFSKGVDDVASECDLDDFEDWDLKIDNNNNEELQHSLSKILDLLEKQL